MASPCHRLLTCHAERAVGPPGIRAWTRVRDRDHGGVDAPVALDPRAGSCAQDVTMAGLADVPFSVDLALADRWMATGSRCTDRGLLAMLARASIKTAGLLMLAFDFTSYGEQIERKEVSGDR